MTKYLIELYNEDDSLMNCGRIQIEDTVNKKIIVDLINEILNTNNEYELYIKDTLLENTIKEIAEKLLIEPEELIKIICVVYKKFEPDFIYEFDESIHTFGIDQENNITLATNSKINTLKCNETIELIGYKETEHVIKSIIKKENKNIAYTLDNEIIDLDKNEVIKYYEKFISSFDFSSDFIFVGMEDGSVFINDDFIYKMSSEIIFLKYLEESGILVSFSSLGEIYKYSLSEKNIINKLLINDEINNVYYNEDKFLFSCIGGKDYFVDVNLNILSEHKSKYYFTNFLYFKDDLIILIHVDKCIFKVKNVYIGELGQEGRQISFMDGKNDNILISSGKYLFLFKTKKFEHL